MSVVIPVSADWLALREPADAAARSRGLALQAARLLHGPVTVHDLGSGTGSMMRWLAPLLRGRQTWVLHDWNPGLLERAAAEAPREVAAVRTRPGHLDRLRAADLSGASLVVGSALLDVLSADEVDAIVGACLAARVPVLFALSVTGRVTLAPLDPGDRVFEAAFNRHQRRAADARRLLGPDAAERVAARFRAAGWTVRTAPSPWRLDAADRALVAEWIDGWVGGAVDERPALQEWAEEYVRTRAAQLAAGVLRVEVHHEDVLAWPP